MKITQLFGNFARGKIDRDLRGRTELPIYTTGCEQLINYVTNFKGNAIYRTGFENLIAFQDCAFVEFRFSNNQNYILVLYNTKIRFLSYDINGVFGWVLDGSSNILEVTSPWTLAESKQISKAGSFSRNADAMIFALQGHEPRKLTRVSANSFTLKKFSRKDDPFPTAWAATKNITAVTKAANAQLTVTAHGYAVDDRVRISSIAGMTELNSWTAAVVSVVDADNFTIDVDTTDFTAYSSGGTTEKVTAGDYPAAVLFYKGRLVYAGTTLKPTTVYMSEAGEYFIHTLPATVVDSSAIQVTLADISQKIEWLFPGDNSLIAGAADGVLAINGGSTSEPITAASIDSTLTSAPPVAAIQPLKKDGLIFYVGLSQRNLEYFNYDILSESFISQDANVISYDITNGGLGKIRHLKDKNDLVYCVRNGELCALNFNAQEKIIGWSETETVGSFEDIAVITDNDGNPQLFSLCLRNSVYYIERQAPYVEFPARDEKEFFTGDQSADDYAHAVKTADKLLDCIYLDNAEIISDYRTATITYDANAGTITAGASSFSSGDVGKQIVYKTSTGYEHGRFEITAYTSATVVEVDVLQTPTGVTSSSWYLSFNELTGLSRFDGIEVKVVTDGAFLGDYTPASGSIELEGQVIHAVVGYGYRGLLKSFPLGLQIQGNNTQTRMKAISQIGARFVSSVGGEFGTSQYRLQPVQELEQGDVNYLPAAPIDGTKYISYLDQMSRDHCFYFAQNTPGPLTLCALIIEAEHLI